MNFIGGWRGLRKTFLGEGGKYTIDTVPIHENKKQTLIIWTNICYLGLEEVQKLVDTRSPPVRLSGEQTFEFNERPCVKLAA